MRLTLETTPRDATHWSTRAGPPRSAQPTAVSRIWRDFALQAHRSPTPKRSKDPLFIDRVRDIVGLYLSPPENAVVLCVDEKSRIQALDRSQPILALRLGHLERHTHDYPRPDTTTLFAAFNVKSGMVISAFPQRPRCAGRPSVRSSHYVGSRQNWTSRRPSHPGFPFGNIAPFDPAPFPDPLVSTALAPTVRRRTHEPRSRDAVRLDVLLRLRCCGRDKCGPRWSRPRKRPVGQADECAWRIPQFFASARPKGQSSPLRSRVESNMRKRTSHVGDHNAGRTRLEGPRSTRRMGGQRPDQAKWPERRCSRPRRRDLIKLGNRGSGSIGSP